MSNLSGKRYLPLVALLGAAAAVLPTLAVGASTGSVQARDFYYMPSSIAITPGGTVTFSQGGAYSHDVHFDGPLPDSCSNSSGAAVGPSTASSAPPVASSTAWSGSCTFNQAGTYTFHCDVHHFTGTVYVNAAGTVPSTTTTSPPPTTTTTTTATTPSPTPTTATTTPTTSSGAGGGSSSAGSPAAGAALNAVALAASQKGSTVRGSADVVQAGSTLTVDLRAGTAAAGHLTRRAVGPGRVAFTVALNARARRAQRRHGRLALTVNVQVAAPNGTIGTRAKHVTVKR
jgi:plastocyanin